MRTTVFSLGPILCDAGMFIELILKNYKNQRIIFVVESPHENRKALASAGLHHEEKFSIEFERIKNFYSEQTEKLFPKNPEQKEFIDIWIGKYFTCIDSICLRFTNENERHEWIAFHLDKLQSAFLHIFLSSRNEIAVYEKGQKFLPVHKNSALGHAHVNIQAAVSMIKKNFFSNVPPDTNAHVFVTEGGVGLISNDKPRTFSSQGSDVLAALIALACEEKEKTEVLFVKEKKNEIIPSPHEQAIDLLGKAGILHSAGTIKSISEIKMSSFVV